MTTRALLAIAVMVLGSCSQTVGGQEAAVPVAELAVEESESLDDDDEEQGGTFTSGAPAYCLVFDRIAVAAVLQPDLDAESKMSLMLDLLEAIETESASADVLDVVGGTAARLRPLLDALDEVDGDTSQLLTVLTPEEMSEITTASIEIQTPEFEAAMKSALADCVPFQREPVAATVDELNERLGGVVGGVGSSVNPAASPEEGDSAPSAGQNSVGDAAPTSSGEGAQSGDPAVLASASSITLTSADRVISPNVSRPDDARAEFVIDRVFAATTYLSTSYFTRNSANRQVNAPPGEKLVVVEYQLLGIDNRTTAADPAFRLVAESAVYNPSRFGPWQVGKGQALNDVLLFQVPTELTSFRIEGGPPSTRNEGFTASYEITLSPDPDAVAHLDAQAAVPDADVEETAASITLSSAEAMATNVRGPSGGVIAVEMIGVAASRSLGPETSGPRDKFVIVDWRATGTDGNVLLEPDTARLIADGEQYGPIQSPLADGVGLGEVVDTRYVYLVPRDVGDVVVQIGDVPSSGEGRWAEFAVSFGQ